MAQMFSSKTGSLPFEFILNTKRDDECKMKSEYVYFVINGNVQTYVVMYEEFCTPIVFIERYTFDHNNKEMERIRT